MTDTTCTPESQVPRLEPLPGYHREGVSPGHNLPAPDTHPPCRYYLQRTCLLLSTVRTHPSTVVSPDSVDEDRTGYSEFLLPSSHRVPVYLQTRRWPDLTPGLGQWKIPLPLPGTLDLTTDRNPGTLPVSTGCTRGMGGSTDGPNSRSQDFGSTLPCRTQDLR